MYKPFLKRLEKVYPDVLRLSLIGAAVMMLLCAIVLIVLSISNSGQHAEGGVKTTLSVMPDEVTTKLVATRADGSAAVGKAEPDTSSEAGSVDTSQALHERTATAVDDFVTHYGKGAETIDKSTVLEAIRAKALQYKDKATSTAFSEGLAATMEKTLADPKVIQLVELVEPASKPHEAASAPAGESADASAVPDAAQASPFKESPIGIVNDVMVNYSRLFAERLEKKEREHAQAEAADTARQAKAFSQICFAAGAFGTFLLLIVIMIGLKIDKNLRALAPVSIPVSEIVKKTP